MLAVVPDLVELRQHPVAPGDHGGSRVGDVGGDAEWASIERLGDSPKRLGEILERTGGVGVERRGGVLGDKLGAERNAGADLRAAGHADEPAQLPPTWRLQVMMTGVAVEMGEIERFARGVESAGFVGEQFRRRA